MPPISRTNDKYSVEAVLKALDVLEAFSSSEILSLAEISDRVGLNKSRVFRLLHTLAERGYIEKSADGSRYVLGTKLLERAACVKRDLRQLALPFMRQLHERFNETVNLGVLDKSEILYIDMLESSRPIRMSESIGSRSPIHSTALGKAIVSFLSEEDWDVVLRDSKLEKFTERTIMEIATLKAEFRKVRRDGYAIDDRENDPEGYCVGVPVFDGTGRPVAAISISGPAERVQGNQQEIVKMLVDLCQVISNKLSFGEYVALASRVRMK